LIVAVFNVFRAPSATVAADGVNAIFGHALPRGVYVIERPTEGVAWWANRQSGVVGYPRNPPLESYYFARHAVFVHCNITPDFNIKPRDFS
jgi:hypothetical protein